MPQLLPVAEVLKRHLCEGQAPRAMHPSVAVDLPGKDGPVLRVFDKPTLTRAQFEKVLEPFLDRDFLYRRGSELNPVTSIFAPITDALHRARLEAKDIDAVLFAGGSSLIPEVRRAVGQFFPHASMLQFPGRDRTLFAVARGAALHAFFLHGLGRPLLRPIAQETVGVLAGVKGFVPLIPAGTELPHPADGSYARFDGCVVPRDLMREVQIVVAADGIEKVLSVARLSVRNVQSAGQGITLDYRLDANKILEVRAALDGDPSATCSVVLENPLCSTGIKSEHDQRMLDLEDEVRQAEAKGVPAAEATEALAGLCLEEKRFERAVDWARRALAALGKPEHWILTMMGIAYYRLGAHDGAEKAYREAVRIEPGHATGWYNLALCLRDQGRIDGALTAARRAAELRPSSGGYKGMVASLLRLNGHVAESVTLYREAARLLDESGLANEFDRGWRVAIAEALDDSARLAQLEAERKAGKPAAAPLLYEPEKLPALRAGALARVG